MFYERFSQYTGCITHDATILFSSAYTVWWKVKQQELMTSVLNMWIWLTQSYLSIYLYYSILFSSIIWCLMISDVELNYTYYANNANFIKYDSFSNSGPTVWNTVLFHSTFDLLKIPDDSRNSSSNIILYMLLILFIISGYCCSLLPLLILLLGTSVLICTCKRRHTNCYTMMVMLHFWVGLHHI